MPAGPTSDVVVVGGGALGAATAVHLARAGVRVGWVTRGRPADGASGRSLAWLNSAGTRSAAYHALRMRGLARYRELAEERPRTWLGLDGGLRWASPGAADDLRHAHDTLRRLGYDSVWLAPEEVSARVAGIEPGAVPPEGAVLNPQEGWVDLPGLVAELTDELRSLGARVVGDAGEARVLTAGGRVTGVATARESWSCPAAVLATGASVPAALAGVGVHVPDATSTGLLVRTAPVPSALRVVLHTPRVALRPAPDGGLVMDAGWSEREVRSGAGGSYEVDDATVEGLLAEASRVLHGGPELRLASYGVGPKPIPGDGEPVLGAVPGTVGYHVAFTHSGATLALVVGELVARGVLDGERPPELEPFRPDRFTATHTEAPGRT